MPYNTCTYIYICIFICILMCMSIDVYVRCARSHLHRRLIRINLYLAIWMGLTVCRARTSPPPQTPANVTSFPNNSRSKRDRERRREIRRIRKIRTFAVVDVVTFNEYFIYISLFLRVSNSPILLRRSRTPCATRRPLFLMTMLCACRVCGCVCV